MIPRIRLYRIRNRILRLVSSNRRPIYLGLVVVILGLLSVAGIRQQKVFSKQTFFKFRYVDGTFYLNTSRFRYVAGGIHYFRVPRILWRDRLERVRSLGANVIDTHIPWNFHERDNNTYDFTGDRDVFEFLGLVHQLGMHAIVRPGPYIGAEWDWGGIPARLLNTQNLSIRSPDQQFMQPATDWLTTILPRLVPLLVENGGPIVLTQIENAYGSFGCKREYMDHLYAIFRQQLGPSALLFTSDFISRRLIECGCSSNGTITALKLHPGIERKGIKLFREFNAPDVPLVFSELYSGSFDRWGRSRDIRSTDDFLESLEGALSAGANVGLYMAHGGTNWGFWNGANLVPKFEAAATSYDHQAPISESGDLTSRFHAMRALIARHVPAPEAQVPFNSPKRAYGRVSMRPVADLSDVLVEHFDWLDRVMRQTSEEPQGSIRRYPETFEMNAQWRGFMLYYWRCPSLQTACTGKMRFEHISDRALVFDDKFRLLAIFSRNCNQSIVNIGSTTSISVLVENMGHVNFGAGMKADRKGILGFVYLDHKEALGWYQIRIPLKQLFQLYQGKGTLPKPQPLIPTFYVGEFTVARAEDTFLRLEPTQWRKGVAFVNGVNVGRYWPAVGPQETLYVPAALLRANSSADAVAGALNTLWLFELEPPPALPAADSNPESKDMRYATFVDAHSIRPKARAESACQVLTPQPAA